MTPPTSRRRSPLVSGSRRRTVLGFVSRPARPPLGAGLVLTVLAGLASGLAPTALAAQVPGQQADAEEEARVLEAVQGFFDVLRSRDVDHARRILTPDARIQSLAEAEDGSLRPSTPTTGQDFFDRIVGIESDFLERMWDATVLIRGRLATVWTPYDFYVNGEFSHCGVDVFTLARDDQGWKTVAITYTVEPRGCEPSPLGPPAGD